MFGRRSKIGQDGGNARDERLRALLHEWKGVEPQPDFEAAVWRRIRASTVETRGTLRAVFLREWSLSHPVWSTALAAAVAIAVGGLAGVSTSTAASRHYAFTPFLHSHTLTGSYLALATGEIR